MRLLDDLCSNPGRPCELSAAVTRRFYCKFRQAQRQIQVYNLYQSTLRGKALPFPEIWLPYRKYLELIGKNVNHWR